jgi:hypothetical protein
MIRRDPQRQKNSASYWQVPKLIPFPRLFIPYGFQIGYIRQRCGQLLGWFGLGLLTLGLLGIGHTIVTSFSYTLIHQHAISSDPHAQYPSEGLVAPTPQPTLLQSLLPKAWAAKAKKKSKEVIEKQLDDCNKTLSILETKVAERSFFTGEDQKHLIELIGLLKTLPDELGTDEPRVPILMYRLVKILKVREEPLEAWEYLQVLITKYPKAPERKRYEYEQKKLEEVMKDPLIPSSLK